LEGIVRSVSNSLHRRASRLTELSTSWTLDSSRLVPHVSSSTCIQLTQVRTYNPTTLLSSLSTIKTSAASAAQRAGRAGRTSPGVCYRLYPTFVLESLQASTSPEVTRTDLTTPILQLKSLGIDDLMKFEWVTSPPAESILRALEGLMASGMLDADGRLTEVGGKVAECPVEANIARMVRDLTSFGRATASLEPILYSYSLPKNFGAGTRFSPLLP
jgi:ATP-dependent RNA helicase DDX35